VRPLDGLPPDIALVPLIGHTHGHSGVAVKTGGRWLLQAGDAYFYHAEMDPDHPYCTPGLRFYQWMLEKNRSARLWNQHRLRALCRAHSAEVSVFCGHDVREFERLSGRSARVPADKIVPLRTAREERFGYELAETGTGRSGPGMPIATTGTSAPAPQ
jgi:glyoxylase-like metal-dependent hydrolase (beta-lactamase superfamily II)